MPEVFDRLQEVTASDAASLRDLYRDYLADTRQALSRLRPALRQQQSHEVADRAHYVKGSSLVLGARRVAECSASLEQAARGGDWPAAKRSLKETLAALDAVQAELITRLGTEVVPANKSAA